MVAGADDRWPVPRPLRSTVPELSVFPNESVTYAIVHHDEHVLVVDKRSGLVTQPGKGHETDTLLNGLYARFGTALQRLGKARDFGLLHRLDRETSGLLVVALTSIAYDGLRRAFEGREVRKFYWAIVSAPPKRAEGVIDRPIIESTPRTGEKKLARIGTGAMSKPAVTAYRTLATGRGGALLECRPVTGRLHQVRVHMESIGCSILGDGLYAPPRLAAAAPRLALHAHRLVATHPVTGATIDAHSPFPRDLRPLLKRLQLPRPE